MNNSVYVFDHARVVSERLSGCSSPQAVCSSVFSQADQSRPGPISQKLSSSHHIIITGNPTDTHPEPLFLGKLSTRGFWSLGVRHRETIRLPKITLIRRVGSDLSAVHEKHGCQQTNRRSNIPEAIDSHTRLSHGAWL